MFSCRSSIDFKQTFFKAFLVAVGSIEANGFMPQMVTAEYLRLVMIVDTLGGDVLSGGFL